MVGSIDARVESINHSRSTPKLSSSSSLSDSCTNYNHEWIKLVDLLPILSQPHCKIRDVQRVERILNEMRRAGKHRLQLMTDFDFTITRHYTNDGTPVASSFVIFESCKSLPSDYVEKARALNNKYRPLEFDPKIPKDDKFKYMMEWWRKSGELLSGFSFDQNELDKATIDLTHCLRDNTRELFRSLNDLSVPVLVFSAGLGDCVVSVLKQSKILHPNVKVISNFLQYKDGLLNGFQEPLIHAFNKNETAIKGSEYYDQVLKRDYIIVMGDSLGDAGMADGVPASSHILKIGFLYHHAEENLEKYMEKFDIVLIDDQTMNVPRAVIDLVQ